MTSISTGHIMDVIDATTAIVVLVPSNFIDSNVSICFCYFAIAIIVVNLKYVIVIDCAYISTGAIFTMDLSSVFSMNFWK